MSWLAAVTDDVIDVASIAHLMKVGRDTVYAGVAQRDPGIFTGSWLTGYPACDVGSARG